MLICCCLVPVHLLNDAGAHVLMLVHFVLVHGAALAFGAVLA